MSILLFCVGAIAFIGGAAMAGFGIPVSEFSFGNTLINSGVTTAVGGLVLIGLGAVVSKLQQIADGLGTQAPVRSGRPLEIYETDPGSPLAPGAAPSRIPFPPKPKPEAGAREPLPLEPRVSTPAPFEPLSEEGPAPSFAPTLRNPDEPPMTVEDEVSLSPQHPMAPAAGAADLGEPARPMPPLDMDRPETAETRQEPSFDDGWRSPPPLPEPSTPAQSRQHGSYFDTMWPPETRTAKALAEDGAKPEPEFELPPPKEAAGPIGEPPEAPVSPPAEEPRAVAVLKSGVVDGMGYTLYVDGSIEAELPQGTLRFASINELRSHLEKDS